MRTRSLKPIETRYQGYRFRSRLEATWAVFFDTLGIAYTYEPERFHLGPGLGWYLPDFWLPQVSMWAEVKAGDFSELEVRKCYRLTEGTGRPTLMLDGSPADRNYWGWTTAPGAHPPHLVDYVLCEGYRYWETQGRILRRYWRRKMGGVVGYLGRPGGRGGYRRRPRCPL